MSIHKAQICPYKASPTSLFHFILFADGMSTEDQEIVAQSIRQEKNAANVPNAITQANEPEEDSLGVMNRNSGLLSDGMLEDGVSGKRDLEMQAYLCSSKSRKALWARWKEKMSRVHVRDTEYFVDLFNESQALQISLKKIFSEPLQPAEVPVFSELLKCCFGTSLSPYQFDVFFDALIFLSYVPMSESQVDTVVCAYSLLKDHDGYNLRVLHRLLQEREVAKTGHVDLRLKIAENCVTCFNRLLQRECELLSIRQIRDFDGENLLKEFGGKLRDVENAARVHVEKMSLSKLEGMLTPSSLQKGMDDYFLFFEEEKRLELAHKSFDKENKQFSSVKISMDSLLVYFKRHIFATRFLMNHFLSFLNEDLSRFDEAWDQIANCKQNFEAFVNSLSEIIHSERLSRIIEGVTLSTNSLFQFMLDEKV